MQLPASQFISARTMTLLKQVKEEPGLEFPGYLKVTGYTSSRLNQQEK
jgi:hypothetical protein